jgi:23S rRNA (guanosine2251-2'-O)-methyltransferase
VIVFGRNTVIEALKSSYDCRRVNLQENINVDEKIGQILELAKRKRIEVNYTSRKSLSRSSHSEEHQGVLCDINYEEFHLRDIDFSKDKPFLYIYEATYEHNVGAIIRTAECAGFGGVVIPNKIEITPTIAKISTGALFHIPVIRYPIFQALKEFKKEGYAVYGIERGGEKYFDVKLAERSLFIIGGEDKSLGETITKECDAVLEIPQFGRINSLNMSNASSIIMFEYVRQNFKTL